MPHRPPLRAPALLALAAGCLALAGLDWSLRGPPPAPAAAAWPAGASLLRGEHLRVTEHGRIPMPPGAPAAHASSLLPMPEDSPARLMAFWFAGQRESAPDVQIAAAWMERHSGQWQPARLVVDRALLGPQLGHGVRRLGNPVAWRDAQDRIHLFVVATGLGGWAAGRVVHLRQTAGTALQSLQFEPLRVLPLSWLWNTSHLVRTAPLPLADGGMLLPLYFELGFKYALAARFDASGELRGLQRISAHDGWLQPSVLMLSPSEWLALMRDHNPTRKVAVARSPDAGQTWQDLAPLDLDNPDASVAGLGLHPGLAVLAHNPSRTGRETLRLSRSEDGRHWTPVADIAQASAPAEFSYPALAWTDGSLWLSYTDQRTGIAWARLQERTP